MAQNLASNTNPQAFPLKDGSLSNTTEQNSVNTSKVASPSQEWVVSWINEKPMKKRTAPTRPSSFLPKTVAMSAPAPEPIVVPVEEVPTSSSPLPAPVPEKVQEVSANVPVRAVGEAPGVEEGGKFDLAKTITVACLPAKKPEFIDVDVSTLHAGETICIKDLPKNPGIIFVDDENFKVATCSVAPKPTLKIGETNITLISPPARPVAVPANVPVRIIGDAPGVLAGGTLNIAKSTVAVFCVPADCPTFINLDISRLQAGESICIKDLALIPRVFFTEDKNTPIVVCSGLPAPKVSLAPKVSPVASSAIEEEPDVVVVRYEDAPAPAVPPQPEKNMTTPIAVQRPAIPRPPVARQPAPPAVVEKDDGKVPMHLSIIDAIICAIAIAASIFLFLEFASRIIK